MKNLFLAIGLVLFCVGCATPHFHEEGKRTSVHQACVQPDGSSVVTDTVTYSHDELGRRTPSVVYVPDYNGYGGYTPGYSTGFTGGYGGYGYQGYGGRSGSGYQGGYNGYQSGDPAQRWHR